MKLDIPTPAETQAKINDVVRRNQAAHLDSQRRHIESAFRDPAHYMANRNTGGFILVALDEELLEELEIALEDAGYHIARTPSRFAEKHTPGRIRKGQAFYAIAASASDLPVFSLSIREDQA